MWPLVGVKSGFVLSPLGMKVRSFLKTSMQPSQLAFAAIVADQLIAELIASSAHWLSALNTGLFAPELYG
jgi:hypothetical protein